MARPSKCLEGVLGGNGEVNKKAIERLWNRQENRIFALSVDCPLFELLNSYGDDRADTARAANDLGIELRALARAICPDWDCWIKK